MVRAVEREPQRWRALRTVMEGGQEPTGEEDGGGGGGRPTILVVDDDPAVRRVASKALRRAGYAVLEASSGEEALAAAGRRRGDIGLLLTDVVMPGMNGRELSERLHETHPHLPVLFMSAYAEDDVFLRGVRVARMNFIAKPFTLEGLVSAVSGLVGRTGEGPAPFLPGRSPRP